MPAQPTKVVCTNEKGNPLRNMDVEVYDVDDPSTPFDVATSDADGLVEFSLPPGQFFFRPRITRGAGVYGARGLIGMNDFQILASQTAGPFVLATADSQLPNGRVLTGSASVLVTDNGAGTTIVLSVIAGGVDHGGLAGLADDDHTQYTRKATLTATGDIYYASAASTPARLAISVPAATFRNVLGADNGDTVPSYKALFDATVPTTIAPSAAAAAGTSTSSARRDHVHGAPATFPATAHNIFSTTHGDTTGAASPVDGDIIIANVTPAWSKLAISIPAANVRNVLGVDNGELRPSWKAMFDATNPAALGVAAPGTSVIAAHRDHVHLDPVTAHVAAGDPHTVYRLESADHSHQSTGLQAGQLDHGLALTGLGDDDHTQYLLLAGRVAAQQDITKGITVSTYTRIGSALAPTNVAAGDLTVGRLIIPDAALNSETRLFQIDDEFTPLGGTYNAGYFLGNITPGAVGGEYRGAKFEVNIRPTAATTIVATGLYAEADHDSGAFNITSLQGTLVQVLQRVAGSTVANAIGSRAVVSPNLGTITTLLGNRVDMGLAGDAGVVSTGIGLDVRIGGSWTGTNVDGMRIFTAAGTPTITTLRGIRVENAAGTITNFIQIDLAKPTAGSTINVSLRAAGPTVYTPTEQVLALAGDAILAAATDVEVSNSTGASLTLTSTPTIANGQDGQVITITNIDATDNIVLQDETVLPGSNLRLAGGVNLTLGPRDSVTLVFRSSWGDWVERNRSNN